METCSNCSNRFEGKFCNECGQKAATHLFTMHEWLHEIPHSIFHVDGGFFYTFKNLCLRPGNTIGEYLAGRRKSYFSPFLYALIMCGIFVVVTHFFGNAEHEKIEALDAISIGSYLQNNYYKPLVLAMILPSSLASFVIFWRSGYNFAEHLVFNTFVTGQAIIADILFFNLATSHSTERFRFTAIILNILLKRSFLIWTYWQFFKPKNILIGILQIVLAIFLSSILANLVTTAVAHLFLMFKVGAH